MSDISRALTQNPASSGNTEDGNNVGIDPADGLDNTALPEDEEMMEDAELGISQDNPYGLLFSPPDFGDILPRAPVKVNRVLMDSTNYADSPDTLSKNYDNKRTVRFTIDPARYGPIDLSKTHLQFGLLLEEEDPIVYMKSHADGKTKPLSEYGIQEIFVNFAKQKFGLSLTDAVPDPHSADGIEKLSLLTNMQTSSVSGLCSLTGVLNLLERVSVSIGSSSDAETLEHIAESFATQAVLKDMDRINSHVYPLGAKYDYSSLYSIDHTSQKYRCTQNNRECGTDMYTRHPLAPIDAVLIGGVRKETDQGLKEGVAWPATFYNVERSSDGASPPTITYKYNQTGMREAKLLALLLKNKVTKSHTQITPGERINGAQIGMKPKSVAVPVKKFQIPITSLGCKYFEGTEIWVGPSLTFDFTFKTTNTFYSSCFVPATQNIHSNPFMSNFNTKALPQHMSVSNPFWSLESPEMRVTSQILPPEIVAALREQMASGAYALTSSVSVRNIIPLNDTLFQSSKTNKVPDSDVPTEFTNEQNYPIMMSGQPSDIFLVYGKPDIITAQTRDPNLGQHAFAQYSGSIFSQMLLPMLESYNLVIGSQRLFPDDIQGVTQFLLQQLYATQERPLGLHYSHSSDGVGALFKSTAISHVQLQDGDNNMSGYKTAFTQAQNFCSSGIFMPTIFKPPGSLVVDTSTHAMFLKCMLRYPNQKHLTTPISSIKATTKKDSYVPYLTDTAFYFNFNTNGDDGYNSFLSLPFFQTKTLEESLQNNSIVKCVQPESRLYVLRNTPAVVSVTPDGAMIA